MKNIKKLLIILLIAVSALCLAVGLTACGDDKGENNGPTALSAPVLDISGTVLSWNAVVHATGYQVYENGSRKADVSQTSYTIPQTTLVIPGTYKYTVKAVSTDSNYTDSPMSNERSLIVNGPSQSVQMEPPVISIDQETGIISWNAGEDIYGYYVWDCTAEPATRVTPVRLTTTTYKITKKSDAGVYSFYVEAVNSAFESVKSEPATFTVEQLDAPVTSFDEENAVLSWTAVENAESYEVYVDGARVAQTADTEYTLTQTPGNHTFAVTTVNGSPKYANGQSETETLSVPLIATINFSAPELSVENVKACLYDEDALLKEFEVVEFGSSIRMVAGAPKAYTVKLQGLPEGYISTWGHVYADVLADTINVFSEETVSVLGVGSKTTTVTLLENVDGGVLSAVEQYVFIAGTTEAGDGIHSLALQESGYTVYDLTAYSNGVRFVDSALGIYTGNFTAQEGEVVLLTFEYELVLGNNSTLTSQQATFEFELVDREIKQYFKMLPSAYNEDATGKDLESQLTNANYLIGSCTRYIQGLDETRMISFFFGPATGDRTITVTINGQSYTIVSNGLLLIEVEAGTDIKVDIHVTGTGYGGIADHTAYWLYFSTQAEIEEWQQNH